MKTKSNFEEMVAYDFNNINCQENGEDNCYNCDQCDTCNTGPDGDGCNNCDNCDNCDSDGGYPEHN